MNIMGKKIALFPGTFDPFTLGHHDIVNRGLKIFDEICIDIGNNPKKKRYFEVDKIKSKKIYFIEFLFTLTSYLKHSYYFIYFTNIK